MSECELLFTVFKHASLVNFSRYRVVLGVSATCWVFKHSLGVDVRVDDALQKHGHVGDFVFRQLFQCRLQG